MTIRKVITTEDDIINYGKHYRDVLSMMPITEVALIITITIDDVTIESSYCSERY